MRSKWLALVILTLATAAFLLVGCTGASQTTPSPSITAALTADSAAGAAPFTVSFTNTSSEAEQYRWDFGDGKSQTTASLTAPVTHEYTAAGTYTVTVTAVSGADSVTSTSTTITVTHGPLHAVTVEPAEADLDIETSQQFTLSCTDEFDNPIEDFQATWETVPGIGTFNAGSFTAGTRSGTFSDALTATVKAGAVTLQATVAITINPGPLTDIGLDDLQVPANGEVQLEFTATDRYGNSIEDLTTTWTLNDDTLGSLSPAGMLHAVKKAGEHPDAVEISVKQGTFEKTATGSVTVLPAGLDQLFIAPENAQVGISESQEYVAAGADEYGNRITDLEVTWSADASAGTFAGTTFTAGAAPDTYNDGITATGVWNGETLEQSTDVTVLPDRIVFLADKAYPDQYLDAYIMDSDGSNVHQLTYGAAIGDVTSSPDGRRIAYVADGEEIYIINTEGDWQTLLLTQTGLNELSWSPDGRTIVYDVWSEDGDSANIYTVDVATGETRSLTDNPYYNFSPQYSPDGKKIAFVKSFPGANPGVLNIEIFVMNADGSNEIRVTEDDYWYDWDPNWTPDSQKIIYDSERNAYYGLFTVNPDGTDLEHFLTPNDKSLRFPDFSPDGSQVVAADWSFSTDWEIAVMNADGTGLVRITDNSWMSIDPVWMKRVQGAPVTADAIPIPDLTGDTMEMTRQEVTEKYKDAVVRIVTDLGSGSGFLIEADGTILTNAHVVREAATITVYLSDGSTHTGTLLGIDTEHDMALVKINASGLTFIELVAGNTGELGQQVVVLGYPLGRDNLSVTSGVISSFEYDSGSNIAWVQTDSAINPGNSGGPMLNLYGELVGMVTAKAVGISVEGVGYAISTGTLVLYLPNLFG
jgi:S1-C subfamily serine protease